MLVKKKKKKKKKKERKKVQVDLKSNKKQQQKLKVPLHNHVFDMVVYVLPDFAVRTCVCMCVHTVVSDSSQAQGL